MELINQELIKVLVLSSVGTYGIVQAIKPSLKRFGPASWPKLAVRLGALVVGGAWGFALDLSATGVAAGVAGAAFSSTIVTALKKVIKKNDSE